MSFSGTSIVAGPYVRNGVTTVFTFGFLALSAAEVEVVSIDADDNVTVLSGYDVYNIGVEGTGYVRFAVAPSASPDPLYVRAKPNLWQGTNLLDQTTYNAADLQITIDRLAQAVLWTLRNATGGSGGGSGGSGGPVTWADIVGKPGTYPPTAHAHTVAQIDQFQEAVEDIVGAQLVAGANVTIGYDDPTGKIIISAAAGGGGGGSGVIKSLLDFGTPTPDGVTDNKAAFDAAELSAYERIYLPEGVWATSNIKTDLKKFYWGPGKIMLTGSGQVLPGRYTLVPTQPTPGGLGPTGWFAGDNKHIEPEYFELRASRKGLFEPYFEPTVIPHNVWMYNYGGWSGASAHLANAAVPGQTTVTIKGTTDGFQVGDDIGFIFDTTAGHNVVAITYQDTVKITGKTANTLTFTPALTKNYAENMILTHGPRTMNLHTYVYLRNYGGGDAYGHMSRVQQNFAALPSHQHCFEASTVGQYGGDVIFNTPGTYGSGWESYYADQGHDVCVIGQVNTYVRDNDTAARGGTWIGIAETSVGSKPGDAAVSLSGKWRVGLDLARLDASSNNYAAIQMASGHRMYFNASVNPAGRSSVAGSAWGILWGNTPGDAYMTHGIDGTSAFLDTYVGTARARIRANGQFNFNGVLSVASDINGQQDIIAYRDLAAIAKIRVSGFSSPVYFWFDGTYLRATKNNGASSVIII